MSFLRIQILGLLMLFSTLEIFSQCETWHQVPDREALLNAYVVYRDYLNNGENKEAFPFWETVFKNAPAADGKSSNVYADGIKLHTDKFNLETNLPSKRELAMVIFDLMDRQRKCFPNSKIMPASKQLLKFR